MKKKLLVTLTVLVLVMLPFLVGTAISKYSPYIQSNSFNKYIIISTVFSIAIVSIVLLLFKRSLQSKENISIGGILFFLLFYPIVGIYGLASAPDLSVKMLEHPEREHLRYILLLLSSILFLGGTLFFFRSNSLNIKKTTRWMMTMIFICAFAEFIWEFSHHYLYPEALKEWASQGRNIEEFNKTYDNSNILAVGAIGRYFQFLFIIWLSLNLYKLQQIKIWCVVINIFFSVLGLISATLVCTNGFPFPKGSEFLMLFFIPGIPFILLYWLGVALLTNFKKSETAT